MTTDPSASPHTPKTFAAWLRDQLSARGYAVDERGRGGQARFAKASGISAATVSRLLSGDGLPEIRILRLVSDTLGVPFGELLVRAGVATPGDLAAAARPITPEPMSAEQAAAELGITDPQAVSAFVTMVNALRPSTTEGQSATGG